MKLYVRLDDRLIHGQITTQWSRTLDITAIVVASDQAAADPLKKNILTMACPSDKKVAIRSVEGAIKLLSNPKAASMKVLLIVDDVNSLLRVVKELPVDEVNIANYARKGDEDSVRIGQYCAVSQDEVAMLREVCALCADSYSQMVPADERQPLQELLPAE